MLRHIVIEDMYFNDMEPSSVVEEVTNISEELAASIFRYETEEGY
jgi:hypothetical protein